MASASLSTHRNRSRVGSSHDQRRFMARRSSRASSGGSAGRTLKLWRERMDVDGSRARTASIGRRETAGGTWLGRHAARSAASRFLRTPG